MPSPLKFSETDPSGLGRGKGVYYRRTTTYKGKTFPSGYFSKYLLARDKKRKSKGWQVNLIGLPKTSKILHTGDGRLNR